jgi:putative NIF3 family GTP cyclohydrolase 1 type 2
MGNGLAVGQTPAQPAAAPQGVGQGAAQSKQGRPVGSLPRQPQHTGPVTALQLTDRIRTRAGMPSAEGAAVAPVDEIVAGDPLTSVTGIATTAVASIDCLKTAVALGRNLIVSLDPVFWSDNDSLDRLEGEAAFKAKRDFIRANNLVCFRLRGHWPAKGPNGVATGMAKELGWDGYVTDAADPSSFRLPPTTLLELAKELSAKLNGRTMRIIGDPQLPVTNVAAKWGNAAQMPAIHLLNSSADVVVVGYTHEWEAVEYAQDMVAAGKKKGLVLLGQSRSFGGGMKYCAEWLKGFISEVPVDYFPVVEPYWNPRNPVFEFNTKI